MRLLPLGGLLGAIACVSLGGRAGDAAQVTERLYFGRAIGDTGQVTEAQWLEFLAAVVTPRFPDGFTVTRAEGRWRGASGIVQRESTYVLDLVRARAPEPSAAVDTIVAEYRRRFRQEAVLRVITEARVRF